jgi:hypothetical protein
MAAVGFGFVGGTALLRSHYARQNQPNLTPLEIKSLQTREYRASEEVVFSSVIAVFQDLGYAILNTDRITGLVVAKSALKSEIQFTANAFVERMGGKSRVRLSFVKTTYGTHSYYSKRWHEKNYTTESQYLDASFYQNFFEHIDSEIFVRSNR